jgi:hypothetical protein
MPEGIGVQSILWLILQRYPATEMMRKQRDLRGGKSRDQYNTYSRSHTLSL